MGSRSIRKLDFGMVLDGPKVLKNGLAINTVCFGSQGQKVGGPGPIHSVAYGNKPECLNCLYCAGYTSDQG